MERKNKLKIKSILYLFAFIGIPIFIILYILFGNFIFGDVSTPNNCPQGQHEEERYGRFGGTECVND